jgi:hypothetical protein
MTAIVVKLSAMQMGGISEKGRILPVVAMQLGPLSA